MTCTSTGLPGRSPSRNDRARNDRARNDRARNDRARNDRARNDRARNDRARGNGGFTLLEVLVAFSVLAVALGVAFEIFATGLRGGRAADALTRAVLIADSRLARVGVETKLALGESEGEADDGTRWRVEIHEHLAADGDDERVTTAGLPVLLDVTVTVSWRTGGGEQSFVLRTSRLASGDINR